VCELVAVELYCEQLFVPLAGIDHGLVDLAPQYAEFDLGVAVGDIREIIVRQAARLGLSQFGRQCSGRDMLEMAECISHGVVGCEIGQFEPQSGVIIGSGDF